MWSLELIQASLLFQKTPRFQVSLIPDRLLFTYYNDFTILTYDTRYIDKLITIPSSDKQLSCFSKMLLTTDTEIGGQTTMLHFVSSCVLDNNDDH